MPLTTAYNIRKDQCIETSGNSCYPESLKYTKCVLTILFISVLTLLQTPAAICGRTIFEETFFLSDLSALFYLFFFLCSYKNKKKWLNNRQCLLKVFNLELYIFVNAQVIVLNNLTTYL